MDETSRKLVRYALQTRYEDLAPATVAACKSRLLDTLGCIAAAYAHPVTTAARTLAERYRMDVNATILGSSREVAPEMAAFANGVALRVLDLSDMYRVKSGGHPSDVIAAALAACELGQRDGRSLIAAIAVAYEVYCACCDGIDLNSQGWDQPVYGVAAAALAAARLLALDEARAGHALALALVPNRALYQTRHGELSSWKGCAAANASRNGVFAALLAQSGFTGPEQAIEGKHGLWDAVGQFEWPVKSGVATRIERTHIKCFPICYHGQSAVWNALALRDRVRVEDIQEVRVATHKTAFALMAHAPSRWAPQTAETADHSLPYVVARALIDGRVDESSFVPEALREPRVTALMGRIRVAEDPALTARHPEASPSHIEILTRDGAKIANEVRYPKGHDKSPLSAAEVEEKFRSLFAHYGSPAQASRVVEVVQGLESVGDVGALFEAFKKNRGER
jgi:2-methylcitrate dehydratase